MTDTETQAIERATAEGFLAHFNQTQGTDYRLVRIAGHGESPDVECVNSSGDILQIEITMTEDNPGDICAVLGRSDHKSLDVLRKLLREVREGKTQMPLNQLNGNVEAVLVARLKKKFQKRYGSNCALVVRETSLPWDWDFILPEIREHFREALIPFDRGVWLLSRAEDRLTKIF